MQQCSVQLLSEQSLHQVLDKLVCHGTQLFPMLSSVHEVRRNTQGVSHLRKVRVWCDRAWPGLAGLTDHVEPPRMSEKQSELRWSCHEHHATCPSRLQWCLLHCHVRGSSSCCCPVTPDKLLVMLQWVRAEGEQTLPE